MIRKKIIEAAMSWVGTPYHHHARVKGHDGGVDCAQLVVGVAIEAGLFTEQLAHAVPNYPVQWHLHNREERLLELLAAFGCTPIEKQHTQPGDIITFKFGRVSSHLGIVIDEHSFVHANFSAGGAVSKVVINTLEHDWKQRWTHTFLFPGVKANG